MHPNRHDYEQLALIYSHLDASTTIASSPASASHAVGTEQVDTSTFVKRFADGSRRITFIVWAR